MAITIERNRGLVGQADEQFGLECPYCGVYAHMTAESIPDFDTIHESRPKHVGLVYQCDACTAPVFLRFAVKQFGDDTIELYRNFIELERPKERFQFSYLPKETEILFREALSCYSNNNFNAFASMCHRAAASAFDRELSQLVPRRPEAATFRRGTIAGGLCRARHAQNCKTKFDRRSRRRVQT